MRDFKNFFTAEDFATWIENKGHGPLLTPEQAADRANALLREAIEASPVVIKLSELTWTEAPPEALTWPGFKERQKARLICVEKVGE